MALFAVGAALAIGGSMLSYGAQRRAANQRSAAAEKNYQLKIQQAENVLSRFKYNRIRERLNAQRFTGKQITAFAQGGVTGRTPLSVIEDTIGVVEESLFNKQMDAEMEAYTIKTQAEYNLQSEKAVAKAEKTSAGANLLSSFGRLGMSFT